MDEERKEDLNPRGEDIEERVRRMMDPTVPDDHDSKTEPSVTKSNGKPIKIQAVTSPVEEKASAAPSAPELPSLDKQSDKEISEPSKSKKVIIPISHDEDGLPQEADNAKPKPKKSAGKTKAKPEPSTAVKKIDIAHEDESPEEIAEKLDQAIADLEDTKPKAKKKIAITHTDDETEEEPIPEEPEPNPEDSDNEPDVEQVEPEAEEQVPQETNSSEQTPEPDTEVEPVIKPIVPIPEPEEEVAISDPAVITDPETDKAVEDIVAKESDELLEVEDAVRDSDEPVKSTKKPRRSLKQLLKGLWAKPLFRKALLVALLLAAIVALTVPTSRYFALNTVGIRASSSLTVLDDSTQQPLKNVKVSLGGATAISDEIGKVQLHSVKLGSSNLVIEKRAFASITKHTVVGWGSNPLGDFRLTPTGTQYTFVVKDFLSEKPVAKVQAESNDANAIADDKGVIKLTIDKPDDNKLTVSIKGDTYRTENLDINPDDKSEHQIKLVPAHKQVYTSKRSGKYDLYSVYIDGKDDKLVLAGSGHERDDLTIVPHPTANLAAYVSTRANQHNSDGYLLSNLVIVDLEKGDTTNVIAAEKVQIISFSGDHLVYMQIVAGASASNPKRYRLMSYNYQDDTNKELAASNYFNDVVAADGAIYYAPSSAYQTGKVGFYRISPDGSNKQTVFDQEVWSIFRTSYDHLALAVQQQWYDYRLGDKVPTKLNSAPSNQTSRLYIDSLNAKQSLWVDNRDGKGTLQLYDISTKLDKTLRSQSGLDYPVRWLSNLVVTYRVKTNTETADYALSLDGGEPVKIKDVTNTTGLARKLY